MKNTFIAAGSLTLLLSSPFAVLAQGVPRGAAQGAAEGNAAAGPVGAVVGGVVGGVTDGVKGLLGIDQRPRFHDYVVRQPSENVEAPEIDACRASGLIALKERLPTIKDVELHLDSVRVIKMNS